MRLHETSLRMQVCMHVAWVNYSCRDCETTRSADVTDIR